MCVWCECVYECMVNVCLCTCTHMHMCCQPHVLCANVVVPSLCPIVVSVQWEVEAGLSFLFCEPGSQD